MKAIVFRIDSPGGSYVASDTIWREVSQGARRGQAGDRLDGQRRRVGRLLRRHAGRPDRGPARHDHRLDRRLLGQDAPAGVLGEAWRRSPARRRDSARRRDGAARHAGAPTGRPRPRRRSTRSAARGIPNAPDTPLVRFCRVLDEAGVLDTVEIAVPGDHTRASAAARAAGGGAGRRERARRPRQADDRCAHRQDRGRHDRAVRARR